MENNLEVLRSEKVRFFLYRNWIDSELTLYRNGKYKIQGHSEDDITYITNATRPKYGNFNFVFVINTQAESEFWSGPRFAVKDYQSCERWLQLLNLVHQRKKAEKIHVHPMSYTKHKEDLFLCSICKTGKEGAKGTDQWTCEFCNYFECSVCHDQINNGEYFIKSSSHTHPLMKIHQSDEKWLSAGNRGPYKCKSCNNTTDTEAYRYHCVECGDYDECPSCIAKQSTGGPAQTSDDLKINLGHLSHVLKPSESPDLGKLPVDIGNLTQFIPTTNSGLYTLDMKECGIGRKYPKISQMSVTTSKYWDLTSIEKVFPTSAYFEVTFHKKEGLLGVGIGNQLHSPSQMLGYQQNSFGVISDGTISYNHKKNAIQVPGIKFTKNDVIGLGIMYDTYNQRRLFFTKNGQYVGFFEQTIHRGMDCYPGVSFAGDSKAIFSVNFNGPFKFDLNSLTNSLTTEKKDWISSIPNELREKIGSYASYEVHALTWRLVSKAFSTAMASNTVWRAVFMKEWPKQNPNLKIKSWMNFYKKRFQAFKAKTATKIYWDRDPLKTKKHAIDNCDFEFECPMLWENLKTTNHGGDLTTTASERFCDKCQKSVYRVTDAKTAQKFTEMGRCVSFIELQKTGAPPGPGRGMMMGKVARVEPSQYNYQDPFEAPPKE